MWRNRGCVFVKIATDWAGKKDWMSQRKKYFALAEKTTFATFTLDSVKLSTVHRKGKKVDENTPRVVGHTDTIIHTREEGLTVQLCGDREVAEKWINGQYSL